MEKCVLLIEDEQAIVNILTFNLERERYTVLSALEGPAGLEMARTRNPDLILLDVMLPGMDGFEICDRLRREGHNVPIIMLTAREEEADKVLGLELGADDYITKPFSMRELLARVKANIRRNNIPASPAHPVESVGDTRGHLTLDASRMEVRRDGQPVELTQREYDLLSFLWKNDNKVFSREELMASVWNYEYFGDLRTVDVTVRRLREKIEEDPKNPTVIITRRGAGYLFSY